MALPGREVPVPSGYPDNFPGDRGSLERRIGSRHGIATGNHFAVRRESKHPVYENARVPNGNRNIAALQVRGGATNDFYFVPRPEPRQHALSTKTQTQVATLIERFQG